MKPTIHYVPLSNGTEAVCRYVFIKDLGCEAKVTTETARDSHGIEEGSADDNLFYCYAPTHEFMTLSDIEFANYINENF